MRIHAIQTGEVQIKTRQVRARREARPARVLDLLADREWTPMLPILCWAIEHPDGLVVVDTGESSATEPPWWDVFGRTSVRFAVAPDDEAGPRMRALGLDPRAARWVVMTHMHTDHAGGLEHFEGAEVVMSEREAAAAFARTGPLNGFHNSRYPSWLEPRRIAFGDGPWESFDDSLALTPDGSVRLLPTPGHTLGHLSVAVDTGERVVLIAGDSAYAERSLLDGVVDGVAQDARAHRDSTARLRELCRRREVVFLPSHDPGSAARLEALTATMPPAGT
jgi:glyoxylase-like metal-dependent hydrolase (beta-lactamase superfamily II)